MQYYYVKDEMNNTRSDVIKLITDDNLIKWIPNDERNSDWREYQAWLAEDPENNVPQEEV